MKYFTREWFQGDLTEAQCARVASAYGDHLLSIADRLPVDLYGLAASRSLFDAVPRRAIARRDMDLLALELVCRHPQTGYFGLDLMYCGVHWDWVDLDALSRRVRDTKSHILCHEVEVAAGGLLEQSFLFFPEDHVTIRFRAVEITHVPIDTTLQSPDGDPYMELYGAVC